MTSHPTDKRSVQERLRDLSRYVAGNWKPISAATIIEAADRIDALEKALGEQKRRTLHLRSEMTGRVTGDAAKKFFSVTEGDIGLIDAALHPSDNDAQVAGPMK